MNPAPASISEFSELGRSRWSYLLLSMIFLVTAGWNLNIQSIANPDEPRYAAAVREMLRGGDPLIPVFNGEVRLQKPILYYWLSVGTGWLGERVGFSQQTAFRLEPLLMGLLTVLGTFILGLRFLRFESAFVTACVLISSNMFHNLSRELLSDMTLTAFLTWFVVFLMKGIDQHAKGRSSFHFYLLAYICAGLACLTKGPILLCVFAIFPLLAWKIWLRRSSLPSSTGLIWGAPLSLLIGLWWYVVMIQIGPHSEFFFSSNNLQRFAASKGHAHPVPFLYYIINLGESFAPWSLFVPIGVWWTLRSWRQGQIRISIFGKLAIFFGCVPFVILSIVPAKRHLYLLPLYPFLALWMGWLFEELCSAVKTTRLPLAWLSAGPSLGITIALALFSTPMWINRMGGSQSEVVFCLVVGSAVSALSILAWNRLQQGVTTTAIMLTISILALSPVILEGTVRPIRERKLALATFYIDVQKYSDGRSIMFNGLNANEAVWYLDKNSEKAQEVGLLELPDQFFGKDERRMLIPVATLLDASLDDSVVRHSPVLCRYEEDFVIVSPKPGAVVTLNQLSNARRLKAEKRKKSVLHGL